MKGRADERLARRGGAVELLRMPAALFGAVARLRGALYDRLLLPVVQVDLPVISVGNIAAGGTGKTPMVAWLIRALRDRGRHPGILSRGYGTDSNQNDEARMLARLLPETPHVQTPDRVAGVARLEGQGVDTVVLDDGFQHRRLARDLDLVLVDAIRPWGLAPPAEGFDPVCAMLPRGLLRESPRALGRADAIVITRTDGAPPERLEALSAEIRRWAPEVPLARARHVPVGVRRILGDGASEALPLAHLDGLEVELLSGIGNPEAFHGTASALGVRIAGERRFPDHHEFTRSDLAGLGDRPVLTTAKDAARLEAGERPEFELLVLDVELVLDAGREAVDALLDGLPAGGRLTARRAIHEGLHG